MQIKGNDAPAWLEFRSHSRLSSLFTEPILSHQGNSWLQAKELRGSSLRHSGLNNEPHWAK